MRLSEAPDRSQPLELLLRLHDAGIDTHHSSSEYDSYPLYLRSLRGLCQTGRSVQHIVKLPEPSFDDLHFDAERLRRTVDKRLRELGTEHLAVVQWMVRTPDPFDGAIPIELVRQQRSEIVATFDDLKTSGKIGEFALFPYTTQFAFAAEHELGPMAFCAYLSLFENEGLGLVQSGCPLIALRPFAGATTRVEDSAEALVVEPEVSRRYEAALRYPLLHPDVATTVVSVNRDEHVALAIEVAHSAHADLEKFELLNAQLTERRMEVVS